MIGKVTEGHKASWGVDSPHTHMSTHTHTHTDLKISLIFCLSPSQMEAISAWNTRGTSNSYCRLQKALLIIFSKWAITFDNNTSERDKNGGGGIKWWRVTQTRKQRGRGMVKKREREGKIDEGESDWEINWKSTKGCANRKWRTEMILLSRPRRRDTGRVTR